MSDLRGELFLPDTESDVCAIVAECAARGHGLVVTGGREALAEDRATLSLAGLDAIVEHAAGDQTLTCGAGCTAATIAATAGMRNQRSGLEPELSDVVTVGGVIGGPREGFAAARLGPVRDQVLGLRVVTAGGDVAHFGGRVVKNVTGYDAVRLMTGSAGALGVITEATLRLRPLPIASATILVERDSVESAVGAALELRAAPTAHSALAVTGGDAVATGRGPWLAMIRHEGSEGALEDAVIRARDALGALHVLDADEGIRHWRELTDLPASRGFRRCSQVRPSRQARAAERLIEAAGRATIGLVLDVGTGRILVGAADVNDAVAAVMAELGPSPSALVLETGARLKRSLDPLGVFAAGRR